MEFREAPDKPAKADRRDRLRQALGRPCHHRSCRSGSPRAYQTRRQPKVRPSATEIERSSDTSPDMGVGMVLVDGDGKVVASSLQRATLAIRRRRAGSVLEHSRPCRWTPAPTRSGSRRSTVAAAGAASSIRECVADVGRAVRGQRLIVADVPTKGGDSLRPTVEPGGDRPARRLHGLYSNQPNYFGTVQVQVEVSRRRRVRRLRPKWASSNRERMLGSGVSACAAGALPPGSTWPTRLSGAAIRKSAVSAAVSARGVCAAAVVPRRRCFPRC